MQKENEEASQQGWKSMKEYFDWVLEKQKEDRRKEEWL